MLGDILRDANFLITGARQEAYGTPAENFRRWADLCNAFFDFDHEFTPEQMAMIAVMLKLSRIKNKPEKDSFIDAAGYIAIAAELTCVPTASLGRPQPVE